jgi:hypothetical protein
LRVSDCPALPFSATARNVLSAVALLGLAAPAQARFLQADPVGYQDQFNLYVHVGNDPVNRADPSGMTCTQVGTQRGGAPELRCRMDFVSERSRNGAWVRRAPTEREQNGRFRAFNSRYTAAANTLARNLARDARIPNQQGDKGGFTITAAQSLASLVDRKFVYVEGMVANNSSLRMVSPGVYNERTRTIDNNETLVTNRTLDVRERHIVHDGGIHGTYQEWTGGLQTPNYPLTRIPHEDDYDNASSCLLGARPC